MAIDAANGQVKWSSDLNDEFARCPVVGPKHIVFGCRGGTLAVLNRADGKVVWSKKVDSRFEYEPLMVTSGSAEQLLFFRGGMAILAKLADGAETPWQPAAAMRGKSPVLAPPFTLPHDPVVPISFYRGYLFFIDRPTETAHNVYQINVPWHPTGGAYTVLAPAPVVEEAKK